MFSLFFFLFFCGQNFWKHHLHHLHSHSLTHPSSPFHHFINGNNNELKMHTASSLRVFIAHSAMIIFSRDQILEHHIPITNHWILIKKHDRNFATFYRSTSSCTRVPLDMLSLSVWSRRRLAPSSLMSLLPLLISQSLARWSSSSPLPPSRALPTLWRT